MTFWSQWIQTKSCRC